MIRDPFAGLHRVARPGRERVARVAPDAVVLGLRGVHPLVAIATRLIDGLLVARFGAVAMIGGPRVDLLGVGVEARAGVLDELFVTLVRLSDLLADLLLAVVGHDAERVLGPLDLGAVLLPALLFLGLLIEIGVFRERFGVRRRVGETLDGVADQGLPLPAAPEQIEDPGRVDLGARVAGAVDRGVEPLERGVGRRLGRRRVVGRERLAFCRLRERGTERLDGREPLVEHALDFRGFVFDAPQ